MPAPLRWILSFPFPPPFLFSLASIGGQIEGRQFQGGISVNRLIFSRASLKKPKPMQLIPLSAKSPSIGLNGTSFVLHDAHSIVW
mmetsp:Transcript_46390/g.91531  ORF Transcript_46390/g.91531 Transcript_46390/m.91531 type:complete len:85 (+) Transcript_46390:351-605(+)